MFALAGTILLVPIGWPPPARHLTVVSQDWLLLLVMLMAMALRGLLAFNTYNQRGMLALLQPLAIQLCSQIPLYSVPSSSSAKASQRTWS